MGATSSWSSTPTVILEDRRPGGQERGVQAWIAREMAVGAEVGGGGGRVLLSRVALEVPAFRGVDHRSPCVGSLAGSGSPRSANVSAPDHIGDARGGRQHFARAG